MPKIFAAVKNEDLQRKLAEANEAAAKAMDELKSWLEGERKNATDAYALGIGLFQEMLKQTEGVDVTVAELKKIGRADLDRNLKALKQACDEYLPRAPIRVCIDTMNSKKPEGGAVEGARAQLASLKAFLVDKHIVTIPGTEEALVAEAPPYNRGNAAYINIPGPYEKALPSTYYIAPPDPNWSEAERAAYIPGKADLLFVDGARSVARPFPAVPACEPQSFEDAEPVGGLCLRRRLGALRGRDDVGSRARSGRSRRRTSAS